MLNSITNGPARALVPARERLDQEEMRRLFESNALIVDDRRRRPLYFDGRFLAARDLTREQNYFLTRQSDLARAGGAGIVDGLMVEVLEGGQVLRIHAGHGVTATGESIVLPQALTFSLTDIPQMQRLDATFGLLRQPSEPPRNRTGVFIVALRPVEFTANPIASYPTTITEKRSVSDGDIIEGVVATLIPYPDPAGDGELSRRRARIARSQFVDGATGGTPVDALPLAMIALERNTVHWIDVFMVRREVGADHRAVLGLGLAPRASREAFITQFDQQLTDVLRVRDSGNRGRRFAASEHFLALPPAGRMPAQSIDITNFTQTFFPPHVPVDLSIIPEDELPALLEESLLLPPIDLMLDAEALASTAVLVLIPLQLHKVRTLSALLDRVTTRTLPTAAPGLIAQRTPLETMTGLRLARLPAATTQPETVANQTWAAVMADVASRNDGLLWYIRRRNVDYRSEVVGFPVAIGNSETVMEDTLTETLESLELTERVEELKSSSTMMANSEIDPLLASVATTSRTSLMTLALVRELEAVLEPPIVSVPLITPTDPDPTITTVTMPSTTFPTAEEFATPEVIDRRSVLLIGERFADPLLGEGLQAMEVFEPKLSTEPVLMEALADTQLIPEIDAVARTLDGVALETFTKEVVVAASTGDVVAVEDAIVRNTLSTTTTTSTMTATTSPTLATTSPTLSSPLRTTTTLRLP